MKYHHYQAFGLNIQSDVELPQLLTTDLAGADADVCIQKARISSKGLTNAKTDYLHYQAMPNRLWLRIPGVGLFQISNGKEIAYQTDPKSDRQTLGLFLVGSCLGALLHQRETIVLHATAVKFGSHAVIFAGVSGEGKSLLAAALHKKGYQILTDDLCVVDHKGMVQPGYPLLKIWRDCFRVLEINDGALTRLRPQLEKYAYQIDSGFCTAPSPVKSIYILHSWNKDEPKIEPVSGMKKLMPLQAQTYRLQYLKGLGLMHINDENLMKLASTTKISYLTRPQDFKVAKWIDLIETDVSRGETEIL